MAQVELRDRRLRPGHAHPRADQYLLCCIQTPLAEVEVLLLMQAFGIFRGAQVDVQ